MRLPNSPVMRMMEDPAAGQEAARISCCKGPVYICPLYAERSASQGAGANICVFANAGTLRNRRAEL